MEQCLRVALVALPLAAAACAPPVPPGPSGDGHAGPPARFGTVVAVRPLPGRAGEIVVRAETGETVALVETEAAGLAVGDRVVLQTGERARLRRVP